MCPCAKRGCDATEGGSACWGMNVPLVSSAPGSSATRRPVSPGIGALCPLQPSFSRLSSPHQRQGPLSSEELAWLPGPGGGEALKSHFMKRPCPWRPSREARAADFPFTTRPTQTRGARAQPALVLTHWEPRGGSIRGDGLGGGALGSKPGFWHLPRGRWLAAVG